MKRGKHIAPELINNELNQNRFLASLNTYVCYGIAGRGGKRDYFCFHEKDLIPETLSNTYDEELVTMISLARKKEAETKTTLTQLSVKVGDEDEGAGMESFFFPPNTQDTISLKKKASSCLAACG